MSIKKHYYFDNAAATPMSEQVLNSMKPYYRDSYYNPSSLYRDARRVRGDLEIARKQVSTAIGAKPNEIVFTAGATESINLAIKGIANLHPKSSIIVSAIEHESVLAAAEAAYGARRVKTCPVNSQGILNLEKLEKLLDSNVSLVSVMMANNEIGTVQPLAKVSALLKNLSPKRKIYLHSDAAQAANYLSLQVERLGVDLLTLNGSKIYGPKQSGCLYVKTGVTIAPLINGGGQERGLRSGTENVAGCIGFAQALVDAQAIRVSEARRVELIRDYLISQLKKHIPGAVINGDTIHRLPNNVHVTIPGRSGERLVHLLDAVGIQAATGSACSANNDKPSHVLLALGLSVDEANSSLRFSLGRSTTKAGVTFLVNSLVRLVA